MKSKDCSCQVYSTQFIPASHHRKRTAESAKKKKGGNTVGALYRRMRKPDLRDEQMKLSHEN